MADPPEQTLLYVEHRYVCSECNHLSPSLEDALLHQQHHLGSQYHQYHQHYQLLGLTTGDYQTITLPTTDNNQYQCLECGQLLLTPGQLLEHQELHMKILQELPERSPAVKVTTTTTTGSTTTSGVTAAPARIHYECVECKALFVEQDLWLAHRQSHRAAGDTPTTAVTLATTPQAGQNQALVDLEHSYRKPEEEEEEEAEGTGGGNGVADDTATTTTVQLLLYECGECLQLFQTPKDFLEHQAAHLTSPAPPLNGTTDAAPAPADHSYKVKDDPNPTTNTITTTTTT
ncbi:ZN574 protein, partial [Atlantisia rogersi]|nr:ZN574 protein [Atlantisia rogersi]